MNQSQGCVPLSALTVYAVTLRYVDVWVVVLMPETSIVAALERAVEASPRGALTIESWNAKEFGLVFEANTSRYAREWIGQFGADIVALDPTGYLEAPVQ